MTIIIFQGLDTDYFQGCEFQRSLEPKLVEIWKTNGMCRKLKSF
eukprot:UN04744